MMELVMASRSMDACLRAREVFLEALDQPDAPARARFVAAACAADPVLQHRVERLLDHHFTEHAFMATPAGGEVPALASAEAPGTRIGRYRLVHKLGEGGMGVVYLAEQEQPVRRQVALKIIKLGMDTRQVVARFEAERQALAMMDHPGIARVFDAGATGSGRPYFVMEWVRGPRITDYCREQGLPLPERLRLFIRACHAVEHAHQKGFIHRDLKPSNLLVAAVDGEAVPKVIDFGIAKAVGDTSAGQTVFTAGQPLLGTPAYMSPEQADVASRDIDTRSDLYSMGVLLYELLTGTTPFGNQELLDSGVEELRRTIREREPEPPSTRLRRAACVLPRPSPPPPALSADLDAIVLKCLEKDRNRRYATVHGLAADVERFLAHEPVSARPPGPLDRLHKLARRNRLAFAAAGAVMLALLLGLGLSTWQAVRATRAERAYQQQAEIATSVKAFLVEQLLGGADPWKRKRYDANDRVLIERIAREVEGRFADQPLVEAAVRAALADGFDGLDDVPNSLQQAERSLALRKAHLGAAHADTLASASKVGAALYALGRHQEGDRLLEETIATARAASQMLTPGAAEALHARGWRLASDGHPELAMPYIREAVDIFRQTLGEDHARTGAGRFMLAAATQGLGQTNEAEILFREAIQQYSQSLGTNDPMVGVFLKGYGLLLRHMGRTKEAVASLESAVAILESAVGPDNQYTQEAKSHLAHTLAVLEETNTAIVRSNRPPSALGPTSSP